MAAVAAVVALVQRHTAVAAKKRADAPLNALPRRNVVVAQSLPPPLPPPQRDLQPPLAPQPLPVQNALPPLHQRPRHSIFARLTAAWAVGRLPNAVRLVPPLRVVHQPRKAVARVTRKFVVAGVFVVAPFPLLFDRLYFNAPRPDVRVWLKVGAWLPLCPLALVVPRRLQQL